MSTESNSRAATRGVSLLVAFVLFTACSPGAGKHFVLVHGAWMGAWAWDDVATSLKDQGATVDAVELPGHGSDTTPVQAINLTAYVTAVTTALDASSTPSILVGHSMGGFVVTEAAEAKPDQVEKLIYLGAYLPKDGDSLLSLSSGDAGSHVGPNLQPQPNGTAKLAQDKLQDIFCADCTATELTKLQTNYRDEPLEPFGEPAHVTDANWGKVKKFYIFTKNDNAISYPFQQTMTDGVTLTGKATLTSSHSPFLTQPTDVANTLVGF